MRDETIKKDVRPSSYFDFVGRRIDGTEFEGGKAARL